MPEANRETRKFVLAVDHSPVRQISCTWVRTGSRIWAGRVRQLHTTAYMAADGGSSERGPVAHQ